ncbi:phosphate ABC transporter, permease protein PstA [Pacificimonas flava]|uniref:Phosphate transport system permease protein PstA n=2 Tax=Pacificimonas TaxID=1960290 RepID=A0A219B6I3_9SPHN|nr:MULTISPECIES: phosphate ABC transporter permease PstA [Pacificimonas]MBZ6378773.1 phosphate ABC transporter permease PstA [Pacificimonas aurantium]OWV33965.1 phosphate ABC transporter, permease protein PstA [Pacificimonas flava]
MTDPSSPSDTGETLPERTPTEWHSNAMQRRIRRRYARERRFRFFGLAALVLAAGFLAFLLFTIVSDGWRGFQRAEVAVEVTYVEDELTAESGSLARADYRTLLRRDLREQFGTERVASEGAWLRLRERMEENPGLLGQTERVWVVASPEVDLMAKGDVDFTLPAERRVVDDEMVEDYRDLRESDRVRLAFNSGFLSRADSTSSELAGVWGALIGSILTILVTLAISFPIGVMTAVYLEEYAPKNRITDIIEVSINNLAAVPSIIFGLLGLAVFLNFFGMPRSAPLVGGLTLALMTLPVIVIAARVALQSVPPSIKDAALGVGASRLQVISHHVLPVALPGILTGTIIGVSRALGETAPLLLIGMRAFVSDIPEGVTQPATVLPVQIFLWSDEVGRGFIEKTSAAIMVLLAVLLSMNALAIYLRNKFERRW